MYLEGDIVERVWGINGECNENDEILSMTTVLATLCQSVVSNLISVALNKTHLIFFVTTES